MAAGPVSQICRAAFQMDNLFEISRREVSMMSTLAVTTGFASHRRHKFADFTERARLAAPGIVCARCRKRRRNAEVCCVQKAEILVGSSERAFSLLVSG